MLTRPATLDDVVALAELQHRVELSMFGVEETSADELRETLDGVNDLVANSVVVLDGERILALGYRRGTDAGHLVDPDIDPAPVYDVLLPWFAERPGVIETFSTDDRLRARLEGDGWRHHHSSFELIRKVTPDFTLAEPVWPEGITISDLERSYAPAIHRLIYVEAGWAEVPGHPDRDFADWSELFLNEKTVDDQQVIAWRDGHIVGVAMGRTWDDGTGWVSQLATAKSERRRGLGRALLLEALRRRVAAGATALGLSVQAANAAALELYLGVGLQVDREWQVWAAPNPTKVSGSEDVENAAVAPS